MALTKSTPELRADAIQRAIQKGRASLRETAFILGVSWPTIKAQVELGKIATVMLGKRLYVTTAELSKHGAALPFSSDNIPQEFVIDSNLDDLSGDD